MAEGDPWFRRRRFGFGFTPVAWPGWAITIGFCAVAIMLDAALRDRHRGLEIALVAVLTLGLWLVALHHSTER